MDKPPGAAVKPRRLSIRPLAILRHAGLLADPGSWLIEDRVLALAYPRREAALRALAARGVTLLLNLHARPHDPARLRRHGLTEVHLPVPDFTAPIPDQLARGVAAIEDALAAGGRVAVHCGAGLGRTGTLLACLLVARGATPADAIAEVRRARPGSLETPAQLAAVDAFAMRRKAENTDPP